MMNYYELLNKMVRECDLTHKKITENCQEYGVKINPSYISKLRSGKQAPASDEVNIALAKACGFEDQIENILFEAYLEKSPIFIKDFLLNVSNYFREVNIATLRTQTADDTVPLIEGQIEQCTSYEIIKKSIDNIGLLNKTKQKQDETLTMLDDSMEPVIRQGSTIYLEGFREWRDGDLFVVKVNGICTVRACFFIENTVLLVPQKNKFKTIKVNYEAFECIGKVKYVINSF